MSAIRLKVTTQALCTAADEVSSLACALQSDFDGLQQQVAKTRYHWIGAAGEQYRKNFAAQKQETQQILSRLRKYPTDLLAMAQIYDKAELVSAQGANGLPSNIIL